MPERLYINRDNHVKTFGYNSSKGACYIIRDQIRVIQKILKLNQPKIKRGTETNKHLFQKRRVDLNKEERR